MSAPEKLNPSYLGPAGTRPEPPSAWEVIKAQVLAPEYRESNLSILKATALFVGGIVFVRSSLGGVLIPAF